MIHTKFIIMVTYGNLRREKDAILEEHTVGLEIIDNFLFLKLGSGQLSYYFLAYICYIYSFIYEINFI